MSKHKIKTILLKHQLHYLYDIYEDLSHAENNSLIYATNAEIIKKAINVVNDYEHRVNK